MNKMKLDDFIAKSSITILEALSQIDNNRHGFLLVIDFEMKVIGVLTDGDIRRAFIKGVSLESMVSSVCTRDFKFLYENDSISKAIEFFKSEAISFLPIVDSDMKIKNVITKKQMHALLLKDLHVGLSYDFFSLDESILEYEIYLRPWGFYKTTLMNDYVQSKIISIHPNEQISLQSHKHREEHWVIAHGRGIVQIGESILEVHCGSSVFIPKGCVHRLINIDDKQSLICMEVQIGDYFGEDDIIRYEDIYGRE